MPVIQCPSCQRKLNLKQMPTGPRIKCPGCSNPITLPTAAAGSAPASGLTPEDEGFDFGRIQFPAAGPAAVSTFQTGGQALNVYQGPIPGDPLGEESGSSQDDAPVPDGIASTSKSKSKLSPAAIAGIIGGIFALLVIVAVIATLLAKNGDGESKEAATPAAATSTDG